MKKLHLFLFCTTALTLGLNAGHALADGEFPFVTSIETNFVGGGVGFVPDYVGSDDYTAGVAPAFRYNFGDQRYVQLMANYASANIINSETYRLGPALRYRFGRNDDVEDDAVAELSEIDDTLEAGLTVGGNWILNGNPRNRVVVTADAMWDTGDANEGFNSTVGAQYWAQASKAIDVGIAGNVQYGDDNFTETYFGIDAADSAASGLDVHDTEGGLTSFSIQPMMMLHLSESWHLGAGVKVQQLTGDAADSPVVDDRGSETQVIGGLGVVYSWGSKVHTR